MTRQHRWQLAVLAAAASLFCVAQAQMTEPKADPELQPAPGTEIVEQAEPADATATTSPTTAEPTTTDAAPAAPAETTAPAPTPTPRVIVSPGTAEPAVQPAPVTPAPAEAAPVQRADVVAEAIYANEHGLIPRGEMAMLHEDKGMVWAEQMARAGNLPQQQVAMR